MSTTQQVETWAASAGVTPDDAKGMILLGGALPQDTTITVSPSSGTLVYHDADGPDDGLTGTVVGAAPKAIAWNLEPGEYDIGFSHPDQQCTGAWSSNWIGTAPGTARALVIAGAITYRGHQGKCDPP
jgi:hypothetical protein